jgi:sigma-B regulation protein RsbU (phosphoserine phosphatase)
MKLKILVVDDEPDLEPLILQRFRPQVRAGEMVFVFAHNGEEALRMIESDPEIEVVLSDINMPVMDGLTLLARLNEMPRLLKTVVVSAYNDMLNLRVAMNRGAYDFVTKPIDFEDLETTVRKTWRELEMLHEARRTRQELAELQAELAVAARIQQSLLPEPMVARENLDVAAAMLPARHVSGDFYDFFQIDQARFGFVVGDVSGKGIPAALFMAVSRTVLRATALRGAPPNESLAAVNRLLVPQSGGHMYVTLFYGILDLNSGRFEWSVGGHAPPLLLRTEGALSQLEGPRGFMVGMFDEVEYEVSERILAPGDTVLVYTDGVTEAADAAGELFGRKRLISTLRDFHPLTAAGAVERVITDVGFFTGESPRADDVTVLAVRYA